MSLWRRGRVSPNDQHPVRGTTLNRLRITEDQDIHGSSNLESTAEVKNQEKKEQKYNKKKLTTGQRHRTRKSKENKSQTYECGSGLRCHNHLHGSARTEAQSDKRVQYRVERTNGNGSESNKGGTNESNQDLHKFYGDKVTSRSEHTTLRLFYNNCNGLEVTKVVAECMKLKANKKKTKYLGMIKTQGKFGFIMDQMKQWQVNITCLAETGVA